MMIALSCHFLNKGRLSMTADARNSSLPFQPKQATRIRTASRSHVSGKVDSCVTVSYFNHSDRAISITERDGTVNILQPTSRSSADEVVVCVSRLMQRDVMERALEVLRTDSVGDDTERDQWIKAYDNALYNNNNTRLEASVEYVIYHRDLMDAGGRCYMPDLDLLVEWFSDRGADHPFCRSQRNRAVMEAIVPGVSDVTFIMMLKAVDNQPGSQRAHRYINVGGQIYHIPVERDTSYPSGVHLVTRTPVGEGPQCSDTIHRSFTFEEADTTFSLHRTVEDAKNGGPVEAMAKNMVELITAKKKVEEANLRAEQLTADEQIQRIRNEGAIAKALQDKEMYSRRNWVEGAKTIAGLLGAAITIYGLWSKFKTSS